MQTKTDLVLPKSRSWEMFNLISARYDLLNQLLSFGLHGFWKKKLRTCLPDHTDQKVLDLATGTADVLIAMTRDNPRIVSACGIDMAEKMLEIGRRKINSCRLQDRVKLQIGDINHIPFSPNAFDAVTISFGIRNVENPLGVLNEMYRVLKTSGRASILEFSIPTQPLILQTYFFYLRHVVPFLGWIFSGNYKAYQYLNQTIESFPSGNDFLNLMREAGFQNLKMTPLCFGIASIYAGEKIIP